EGRPDDLRDTLIEASAPAARASLFIRSLARARARFASARASRDRRHLVSQVSLSSGGCACIGFSLLIRGRWVPSRARTAPRRWSEISIASIRVKRVVADNTIAAPAVFMTRANAPSIRYPTTPPLCEFFRKVIPISGNKARKPDSAINSRAEPAIFRARRAGSPPNSARNPIAAIKIGIEKDASPNNWMKKSPAYAPNLPIKFDGGWEGPVEFQLRSFGLYVARLSRSKAAIAMSTTANTSCEIGLEVGFLLL